MCDWELYQSTVQLSTIINQYGTAYLSVTFRERWSTSSSFVLSTPFRPTPFRRILFTASSMAAVSDMRPLEERERRRGRREGDGEMGRGGRGRGRREGDGEMGRWIEEGEGEGREMEKGGRW